MSRSRRTAWALAVVAGAAILAAAPRAQAAEKEVKIAVVDTDKLMTSPRFKQYNEQLAEFVEARRTRLNIRNQKLMLNEAEIKELIDLKTKEKRTAEEDARVEALEKAERDRDAELKRLQEAKNATEQDKARLKELQDMRQKSKDTGDALMKDYETECQSKAQSLDVQFLAEVRDVIKQVSEAKGFTLVLGKTQVLYGGTDVTDDVIAKLDRKIQ